MLQLLAGFFCIYPGGTGRRQSERGGVGNRKAAVDVRRGGDPGIPERTFSLCIPTGTSGGNDGEGQPDTKRHLATYL